MGFPGQEYLSGLPFPSPGDLPDPGTKPRSPVLQADSLLSKPPGNPRGEPKDLKINLIFHINNEYLNALTQGKFVSGCATNISHRQLTSGFWNKPGDVQAMAD